MTRFIVFAILAVMPFAGVVKAVDYELESVAQNLDYPWSIAFLPSGDYLVSLRVGELRRISKTGDSNVQIQNTPDTFVKSQGGYFDVVLDPDFAQNNLIYLALAHGDNKANTVRVIRAELQDDALINITPIFTASPTKDTPMHYGGRLLFLNDASLLLVTGDGYEYREASQDPFSQLGKIIRMDTDGKPVSDNPFADGKFGDPHVYSFGHRNPQGLSYDAANNIIYMHEHGPKGGDEVNVVTAGANYGWPVVSYGVNYSGARVSPFEQKEGIVDPIKYWVPSIAPSGLAYYGGAAFPDWQGDLFVGALVDKEVRRLDLLDGKVINEETLFSELGSRIREVRQGPDGFLYLLTDSPTGRLVRVTPAD